MSKKVVEYSSTEGVLERELRRGEISTLVFYVVGNNDTPITFEARIEKGEVIDWKAFDAAGNAKNVIRRRIEEWPDNADKDTTTRLKVTCWVCVEDEDGEVCIKVKCPEG